MATGEIIQGIAPPRGLPAPPASEAPPDPRQKGAIQRGRGASRPLGPTDAGVKKFFPGDDEDIEMGAPISQSNPSLPEKPRWVTLSGSPSRLDPRPTAIPTSIQQLDTSRPLSPPTSYLSLELLRRARKISHRALYLHATHPIQIFHRHRYARHTKV